MKKDTESYAALIERGLEEVVCLTCDSEEQARSIRNELYQVRKTMTKEHQEVAFRIHGRNLKIGPAELLERDWAQLP